MPSGTLRAEILGVEWAWVCTRSMPAQFLSQEILASHRNNDNVASNKNIKDNYVNPSRYGTARKVPRGIWSSGSVAEMVGRSRNRTSES
jgi:hypothetical protein